MNDPADRGPAVWADARLAAAMLAVDGAGLGGIRLRARAGPVRSRWLELLTELAGTGPMTRLPAHAEADRLCGGLDLAATLRSGRPVAERGLLQEADGGLLQVIMAERLEPDRAAAIAIAMDTGRVAGPLPSAGSPGASTRFGVVALDEGVEIDERVPDVLAERLALSIDLDAVMLRDVDAGPLAAEAVAEARRALAGVRVGEQAIEALCGVSVALGIDSMRAPWLALRVARASAALAGRREVTDDDIAAAARLVLAPRATMLPASEEPPDAPDDAPESPDEPEPPPEDTESEPRPEEAPDPPDAEDDALTPEQLEALTERVLDAVRARLPEDLLNGSLAASAGAARRGIGGKSGALQRSGSRGRPAGVRPGRAGRDARLNLVETLRAAAPWQKLRGAAASGDEPARVAVRPDDFRVTRYKQRRETTTIFVVDASGSAALHRLAEAKGAVELLLADCYVRRDRVALVTFRGTASDVLLPPTRSLVQAKRRLAELPGGGGTPLAAGLDRALELADAVIRRGATPVVVVLTDGRANIAADGTPGRPQARADAISAGQRLAAVAPVVMLVDTSPRPRAEARELAAAIGARYLPLPHADAAHLSAAVRSESA